MSFWDSIKPSKPAPVPTELSLSEDKRRLTIEWSDGARTAATAQTLRRLCPCAECVDEWTQKRTIDPQRVPETTTIEGVAPVGNYAVQFNFSDQHYTGIFDWPLLREVTEQTS